MSECNKIYLFLYSVNMLSRYMCNYLCIAAQPVIVQAPQNVQTSVGKTIELHCVATGNPKPHVTWTFNGVTISGTARARITSEGSLAITNIQHGDRGLYRCRAENSHGFATAEARVNVHGKS